MAMTALRACKESVNEDLIREALVAAPWKQCISFTAGVRTNFVWSGLLIVRDTKSLAVLFPLSAGIPSACPAHHRLHSSHPLLARKLPAGGQSEATLAVSSAALHRRLSVCAAPAADRLDMDGGRVEEGDVGVAVVQEQRKFGAAEDDGVELVARLQGADDGEEFLPGRRIEDAVFDFVDQAGMDALLFFGLGTKMARPSPAKKPACMVKAVPSRPRRR